MPLVYPPCCDLGCDDGACCCICGTKPCDSNAWRGEAAAAAAAAVAPPPPVAGGGDGA